MVASLAALFATVAPEPPSSRIVEIKIGTCGDF
jgi:hypothetical protein